MGYFGKLAKRPRTAGPSDSLERGRGSAFRGLFARFSEVSKIRIPVAEAGTPRGGGHRKGGLLRKAPVAGPEQSNEGNGPKQRGNVINHPNYRFITSLLWGFVRYFTGGPSNGTGPAGFLGQRHCEPCPGLPQTHARNSSAETGCLPLVYGPLAGHMGSVGSASWSNGSNLTYSSFSSSVRSEPHVVIVKKYQK